MLKKGGQKEHLTQREWQVLIALSEGKLNKEIGHSLDITLDTVKKHLKNLYRKINARNRIEAARYAMQLESSDNKAEKLN